MAWTARLQLDYSAHLAKTQARHRHEGPLRILQSLYPEGDSICHNVLIHPPGGLVGGDVLDTHITAAAGSHGLITTPGASRFYRSAGEAAIQQTHISLTGNARLEWLPQESICYNDCIAENRLQMELDTEAQLMGWDIIALGLPHAQQPFKAGRLHQQIEVPGVWLERATINASNHRLFNSPLGLAGHACMASLFFITGKPLLRKDKETALELAQQCLQQSNLAGSAGVTSPNSQVVVMRALAPQVESAMQLLKHVRMAWRKNLWGLGAGTPRIWAM